MSLKKFNLQRSLARKLLLQCLYSWQITKNSLAGIKDTIILEFRRESEDDEIDMEYLDDLFQAITDNIEEIDDIIKSHITRDLRDVSPIELAALRTGVYEIMHRLDVPDKVIINEAVELVKEFGVQDGYKFINGVLDKVLKHFRRKQRA